MLAVRAKPNGMEIEFTEPLQDGDGWNTEHYEVKQWYYKPTIEFFPNPEWMQQERHHKDTDIEEKDMDPETKELNEVFE